MDRIILSLICIISLPTILAEDVVIPGLREVGLSSKDVFPRPKRQSEVATQVESHVISKRVVGIVDPVTLIQSNANSSKLEKRWPSHSPNTKEPLLNRQERIRNEERDFQQNSEITLYFGLPSGFLHNPPPKHIKFENTNGNTVLLVWVHPPKPVLRYEILLAPYAMQQPLDEEQKLTLNLTDPGFSRSSFWFKKNNLKNFTRFFFSGNINETLLNVSSPGVVFDVRLRAYYPTDQSVWASTIIATPSQQYSVVSLPENIRIISNKPTSIKVKWDTPRGITGTRFVISRLGSEFREETTLRPSTKQVTVTDLIQGAEYRISLQSIRGNEASGIRINNIRLPAEVDSPVELVLDASSSTSGSLNNINTESFSNGSISESETSGGGGGTFIQDCEKSQRTDLVILIDGSWSVGPQNFEIMQDFLVSLVEAFTIGFSHVLVGLAQYSDDPQREFNLNDHVTKESLVEAIRNIPYKGGNTATGRAIDFIREEMFTRLAGERHDIHKTAIVITDGESLLDDVTEPARRLRESGVEVFSIGVRAALRSELEDMASEPVDDHVYSVEEFDDIKDLREVLLKDVCRKIAVCRNLRPPRNGDMVCDNEVFRESTQCIFTCNQPNYKFNSDSTSVALRCLKSGYWNRREPRCISATCDDLEPVPHGAFLCSNSNSIGSVCNLQCEEGYQTVGETEKTCGTDRVWSIAEGSCELVSCSVATPPSNGNVRCTQSNFYSSVCSFSCDEGYELEGSKKSTCQVSGSWNHRFPTCRLITCSPLNPLRHGSVSCSDSSVFASRCEFSCSEGFVLVGAAFASCSEDGEWEFSKKRFPNCQRIRCSVLELNDHVTHQCTDGNNYGSECSFRCDRGYNLVGAKRTDCEGETSPGLWSHSSPDCRPLSCPALEPDPYSRLSCSNSYYFRSQCTLSCDTGYELNGSSVTTCSATEKWRNPLGTCTKITCDPLDEISNGRIDCSDENNFLSTCTYECDEGYRMTSGSKVRNCQADRTYDGLSAVCSIKQCPVVLPLSNGEISCSDGNSFRSVCTLTCNVGFELDAETEVTSIERTCSSDSTWTNNELVTCTMIRCGILLSPVNGGGRCTDVDNYGSICQFRCNLGYEMVGPPERLCQDTKLWTGVEMRCNMIQCDILPLLEYGSISCSSPELLDSDNPRNANSYGSSCSHVCNKGYLLTGSRVRECSEDGTWTGTATKCQIITCPVLNTLMYECTNGNQYGSQCTASCNEGFELAGSSERICQVDGSWSGQHTTCTLITCEELPAPSHGSIECSDSNSHLSTCEFQCDVGYNMTGGPERTCTTDGTWSGSSVTCEVVTCRELAALNHGEIRCSDGNRLDSVCEFICDIRYELVGSQSRKCEENGIFDGEPTSCQVILCPLLEAPDHGLLSCSDNNRLSSECLLTCDEGYKLVGSVKRTCQLNKRWSGISTQCELITCSVLSAPSNGRMTCLSDNEYQSDCLFQCDEGYHLIGSDSKTCQIDQTWTGIATKCRLVTCESFTAPSNGQVECSSGSDYNSVCQFTCDIGFTLEGSRERDCQSSGEWTGEQTTCGMVTCPTLRSPSNGRKVCSDDNNFESDCRFICDVGYELSGSRTRTCQADGSWSGMEATCDVITCPEFGEFENGHIRCTDANNFESECRFSCGVGFELVGIRRRICQDDGTWSGVEARCELNLCPTLRSPNKGRKICSDGDNIQSDCRFICDVGYELSGSRTRTCQADGSWSGVDASCNVITCPELEEIENGNKRCTDADKFESECRFSCGVGFELVGIRRRICQDDGRWSGVEARCELVRCGSAEAPAHGSVSCSDEERYNSVCEYSCNQGYDLVGQSTRTCQEDRIWTGRAPSCEIIRCGLIQAPSHGSVDCSKEDKYESVCEYQCDEGYRLVGTETQKCKGNREWSSESPVCEKITCTPLEEKESTTLECSDQFNEGSRCRYIPDPGYLSVSDVILTCIEGKWNTTSGPVHIIVLECEELEPPRNGAVKCSTGNVYLSSCSLFCDEGYELLGSTLRQCNYDEENRLGWTGEETTCSLIECPSLSAISNGKITCTNLNRLGSRCSLACNEGYELVGENQKICGADRTWDNQAPTLCLGIICGPISDLLHGSVRCSEGDSYNSVCEFECDSGYELRGSRTRTCLDAKTWSGEEPTCRLVRCSPLEEPRRGSVSCSNENFYESVCEHSCNTGYILLGSETQECLENGKWSNRRPHCKLIKCGKLYAPTNGLMACSDMNKFNSICEISCLDGHQLIGSRRRICQETAEFSGTDALCRRISCSVLTEIDNGTLHCVDGNSFESSCTYVCDTGFQLIGSMTRRCTASGEWSAVAPKCQRVKCNRLRTPRNGGIRCTADELSGSTCTLTCDPCYVSTGSLSQTCRNDGVWSDGTMFCSVSRCSELRAPRNGRMSCAEGTNECGATCTFSCNPGYKLEGPSSRTCSEDLSWTNVQPRCLNIVYEGENCPTLVPTEDLTISCTNDENVGSNCTFQCEEGQATLLGPFSTLCLDDGSWSNSMPICRACKTAVSDILFIVDGSWSVGEANFRKVKDFLKALVKPFQVGWDNSRFAIVQYSDDPRTEFLMNEHLTIEEVMNAIDAIPYKGGNTNTGRALSFGLYTAMSPSNGARPYIAKVALVLTDGRSQDLVGNPAREMRQAGVQIITVGVGDADINELKDIASPPYDHSVYHVSDYDSIKDIQLVLAAKLCEGNVPRYSKCGCPAGPPGQPGLPGRHGVPGESVKGAKGDPYSVMHVNYRDQTITAHNGNGDVVDLDLPRDLVPRSLQDDKVFFAMPGPAGAKGASGEKGDSGNPGFPGNDGRPGPQGELGPQGPHGPPGTDGGKGEPGPRGTSGRVGDPGPPGRIDHTLKTNMMKITEDVARQVSQREVRNALDEVNGGGRGVRELVAPKGVAGPPGPPGPPGSKGDQGFEGPVGSLGVQGPPGIKGSMGEKGSLGDRGPRGNGLPGPQGPQGSSGPRGPPGKTGRTGPRGKAGKRGIPGRIGKSRKQKVKPKKDELER